MGKIWNTYQSPVSSKAPTVAHTEQRFNPNVPGTPVRAASFDNALMVVSQALYRNGTPNPYRFAQSVMGTWWNDNFDWETEQSFQVQQFAGQFGSRSITENSNLPSYDESRLLYGR